MSYIGSLLKNVHQDLQPPVAPLSHIWERTAFVKGVYDYFHYGCDGSDDTGWGCGFRTLQTICSWILRAKHFENAQIEVPSIPTIREVLVNIGDKPPSFLESKDWIGSIEIGFVLNYLYDVDFKIIHINESNDWENAVEVLFNHFQWGGCPVMMGGYSDGASKCIVGVFEKSHLLIVDPHFVGRARSSSELQALGWVRWREVSDFSCCLPNFYNMCIPQFKVET